jgi:hypothetical protein
MHVLVTPNEATSEGPNALAATGISKGPSTYAAAIPLFEALVLSGQRPSTINPQGVRYASHAAATRLRLLTR